MTWHPDHIQHRYGRRHRPEPGEVVAYDYRAWEVTHVSDAVPTDEENAYLERFRPPARAEGAPYRVSLRRLHGAPHPSENDRLELALRVPAGFSSPLPTYRHGRVPLCSCCSHPWPCLEADQQAQAEKELAAAEKALALLPGCCPACSEPVTSRQRSITFGGPNVTNPLAEGPTYHLRRKCRPSAALYEEKWVQAEPGRKRSLLTLTCSGSVIVHHDGSAECHGAPESDCPSIYARHRSYMACYVQSHGCGMGCTTTGHPGTRIADRPSDPRAITR